MTQDGVYKMFLQGQDYNLTSKEKKGLLVWQHTGAWWLCQMFKAKPWMAKSKPSTTSWWVSVYKQQLLRRGQRREMCNVWRSSSVSCAAQAHCSLGPCPWPCPCSVLLRGEAARRQTLCSWVIFLFMWTNNCRITHSLSTFWKLKSWHGAHFGVSWHPWSMTRLSGKAVTLTVWW